MPLLRKPSLSLVVSLAGLVVLASSCRSILGITPGKDGINGNGGSAGTVDGTGGTGLSDTGGSDQATGGAAANGSGGQGSGGQGSGGSSAIAGSSSAAGGAAGAAPAALLPAGACADCFARDCPAELAACQADSGCVAGVPDWLGCMVSDAGSCVTGDAGALKDFETCGTQSCNLCQHLTDGTPTIEILSPSNGATIPVDASHLIEVTARVTNFKVTALGTCATDASCGHIHYNLDDEDTNNCRNGAFYNVAVFSVDANDTADDAVNLAFCKVPPFGKPVTLSASLSNSANHMDRVPAVKATVLVTLTQPPP